MINSKVSIIIPVYNVESYLDRCLKSVVEQTYSNIEIIVVDDGSIDDSYKIVEKYTNVDERVVLYRKNNGGLSSARNYGLSKMTGDYLLFLDGDDFLSEEAISTLMEKFIDNEVDISVGSAEYFYENDHIKKDNESSYRLKDAIITSDEAVYQYFAEYRSIYLSACFKIYKKSVFDGIEFPIGKIHEDAYVFPIIYSNCKKISTCKEILFYYLQREGSITNSKFTDNYIKNELDYRLFLVEAFNDINHELSFFSKKEYCNALISYGKFCSNVDFYNYVISELKRVNNLLDYNLLTFKQKIKYKFSIQYISLYRLLRRKTK